MREALNAHNRYRKLHGSKPLKLNKELNQIAQDWAEKIAQTGTFEHNTSLFKGQSLGENLAMRYTSSGEELSGELMTDQWYEEANTYNYNEDFQTGKGHFAQIIWNDTQQVGFGRAQGSDGKWYAVANYYPAGNYVGQFRQNVHPPKVDRI